MYIFRKSGEINMKKQSKKFLAIVLTMSLIVSVFGSFSTVATETKNSQSTYTTDSFVRIENEDGIRYIGSTGNAPINRSEACNNVPVISTANDYNEIIHNNKADLAHTAALPSFVDNSTSKYFPAIGNQGGLGSCQYWAQVYYQFTYTMNKEKDVTTTAQNTFSPQWAYNVIASTDDMVGTYYNLYTMMQVQGNVFQSQVPYTEDTTSYYPTEDVWKTSIKHRVKGYQLFEELGGNGKEITSPDDPDLLAIKTSLSNGDVIAFSSYIYSWDIIKLKQNTKAPENKKYENQEILREVDGSEGSHRLTIVGYNDNIWCDVNDNNTVDTGEMGAFKIANSWGDNWGNAGFMWVTYDALNKVSCVEGAAHEEKRQDAFGEMCRIDVMKYGEDSQLYLKYTVNTADRTQVKISITLEKDGTPYTRQVYSNIYHGDKIAYDGSKEATDATMVALLSNVVAGIKSEDLDDYSMSVTFEDMQNDSNILTVKDVVFVDETAGKVYSAEDAYPLTLNGEKETVNYTESKLNHAVVYYRGYDNPVINYKVADSDFVEADLVPTTERRGYVHKYTIDLGESDSATLYFSDKKGNTDDNSGGFFTATKGVNYYVTEGVATPIVGEITSDIDGFADVDTGLTFNTNVQGGYAPYTYRYTFTNLSTNEITVDELKDKSDTPFYFRQEGKYKVSVEVTDFSDKVEIIETTVEIKNVPFSFKEIHTDKSAYLVGNAVTISAMSQNEKIIYTGRPNNKYTFDIKDAQGNTCHTSTVFCKTYDLTKRFTNTTESFVPHKSGTYTATISSTDGNKEFAQLSITFDVFDKRTGDTDSDGAVSIIDATHLQRMLTGAVSQDEVNLELSDCDKNESINVLDATYIQRYVASLSGSASVGEIVEYIPPVEPEEPDDPSTEEPSTEPIDPPVAENKVTFTNSFRWSGNISCYYWSDENTTMTSWPGTQMTSIGQNEYGETMYTFIVPKGATYIIFTNGSSQTTDITYGGGEIRYYPVSATDSKGHNLVQTW